MTEIASARDSVKVLAEFEYRPAPGLVAAVRGELEVLFASTGIKVDLSQIATRPL